MENMIEIKGKLIQEIEKRVQDKIIEKSNADLIIKLINNVDSLSEAISIAQLGTTYKRTGFHFDKRLEKMDNTVKYLKKNELLSFKCNNDNLTHKLIIGDNYDALLNLLIQYKDKIDVIYIDPPYGKDYMGNFAETNYDNAITRDNLLSMLYSRLYLARELLNDNGFIFISIDDKNEAYLKCLCDEIFEEANFISCSFVLDNLKGKTNDNFITSVGSKLLVYAKDKKSILNQGFNEVENIFGKKIEMKYNKEDVYGYYCDTTFKKTGQSKNREDRPLMYYPILVKNNLLYKIEDEEYNKIYNKETKTFDDKFIEKLRIKYNEYKFILPLGSNGEKLRWTSNFATFKSKMNKDIYYNNGVKQKNRPETAEMLQIYASGTPKSLMYKPSYSNGTQDFKDILPENNFDFPKPVELIKDILKLICNKDAIVLDFFAGTGTTGQAVMDLNRDDGGNRRFILCTNNEITEKNPNGIAFDVTIKRLKRIMTGECYDGNKNFNWINNNKPYNDNLEVYEISRVANFESAPGKTPFDVIDETLYGVKKMNTIREKIEWVCNNFEHAQKSIESDKDWRERVNGK